MNVIFGNYNSADLGLFLTNVSAPPPAVKRSTVSMMDIDGVLDLSSALSSRTRYSNRNVVLTFVMQDYTKDWLNKFSDLTNKLHGKKMNVYVGSDTWYYDAFVTVTSTVADGNSATVVINLDAYPYMRKSTVTTSNEITMTGDVISIVCANSDMPVIPVFKTSNTVVVGFNGTAYTFTDAGDHESTEIVLEKGNNRINLRGTEGTTVVVKYREGKL